MRGYEPTDEERRIFRGPDGEARRALVARLASQMETGEHLQHNRIAMRSEADWRALVARIRAEWRRSRLRRHRPAPGSRRPQG